MNTAARLRASLTALAVAIAAIVLSIGASAPAQAKDLDCSDFASQAQAQANLGVGDPNGLDADGDGRACDSLPCPCAGSAPPKAPTKPSTPPQQKPSPKPKSKPKPRRVVQDAIVTRVVDGDTVKVRLTGGGNATVRILGIDTPEVSGGTECYGPEAEDYAEKKLPKGTRVRLTSDPSQDLRDRYGRILRYMVKKSNGVDFGKAQIKKGNATVYVFQNNPFERTRNYRGAEKSAKNNNRGLWGAC